MSAFSLVSGRLAARRAVNSISRVPFSSFSLVTSSAPSFTTTTAAAVVVVVVGGATGGSVDLDSWDCVWACGHYNK